MHVAGTNTGMLSHVEIHILLHMYAHEAGVCIQVCTCMFVYVCVCVCVCVCACVCLPHNCRINLIMSFQSKCVYMSMYYVNTHTHTHTDSLSLSLSLSLTHTHTHTHKHICTPRKSKQLECHQSETSHNVRIKQRHFGKAREGMPSCIDKNAALMVGNVILHQKKRKKNV